MLDTEALDGTAWAADHKFVCAKTLPKPLFTKVATAVNFDRLDWVPKLVHEMLHRLHKKSSKESIAEAHCCTALEQLIVTRLASLALNTRAKTVVRARCRSSRKLSNAATTLHDVLGLHGSMLHL